MALCRKLMSDIPLFVLLSAHTPGYYSPVAPGNVLRQAIPLRGKLETGEMLLATGSDKTLPAPGGAYARIMA